MNENKTSCAPADNQQTLWDRIDWTKAELAVRKLQARIVKAQKEGRYNKVKALQWTLTHSFYAKALAVKRVTSNGGGNTPGVDMETWEKPEAKTQAISELKRRGYQPKPLRRVHIKKSNGKLRPLGIPTMKDRAMQALYLMALEPVSETTADSRSYGFRKERRCMDAVMQCHNILRKGYSPEWILEGDIKGCFDHISHEWLLANIPMDKAILRKWLKCGYIFNKQMFPTEEGTPQGGIISPTLANMTLDGLQKVLAEEFKQRIANNEFLEYEEVYKDRFYGTLKAQVEKQLAAGQNVIFDVDVVGGCNIKKFYGDRALSVFIQPPSLEELRKRLTGRGTDAPEVIESRLAKATFELSYAEKFDVVIVNDNLEKAQAEALKTIRDFIQQ